MPHHDGLHQIKFDKMFVVLEKETIFHESDPNVLLAQLASLTNKSVDNILKETNKV